MREQRYSILADIQDAIERAKQGKLALYWQRTIQREYRCKKVTPAEQQAYEQLQSILSEVPQWSDEEELHHDIENIGGKLWFCHFWIDPLALLYRKFGKTFINQLRHLTLFPNFCRIKRFLQYLTLNTFVSIQRVKCFIAVCTNPVGFFQQHIFPKQ